MYVKGQDTAIEEVPASSIMEHDLDKSEQQGEDLNSIDANTALHSKISACFAEGPPRTRKWDMDLDIDSEYGPRTTHNYPSIDASESSDQASTTTTIY